MKTKVKIEGMEVNAHDYAADCAEAWTENTGAKITFINGKWEVIEFETDPEHFTDTELIEEFSGQKVEVLG